MYEVIAAYLYRFTNYIDWPQQARGGRPQEDHLFTRFDIPPPYTAR